MYIVHRLDSTERKHYLLEKYPSFVIKPKLLYVGQLNKSKEWRDDMHSHKFVEILFITDGEGTLIIEETEYKIKKGDIIIYNANVDHQEVNSDDKPLEAYFIAYNDIMLTGLEKNQLLPSDYSFMFESEEMYPTFYTYFKNIVDELSKKRQFFNEIAQNQSRTLLMYIYRLINNSLDTTKLLSNNSSFNQAIEYIDLNFREEFTLDDVANKFYINKYYLAHLFKSKMKSSIRNYVLGKRLEESRALLTYSHKKVQEICHQVGFNNLNYFCRIFKKTYGITPLNYRKFEK